MYADRASAGELLGEQLAVQSIRPDAVFAGSPGAVKVTRPLCDRFEADCGLLVAESIRAPSSTSLPVGAVTNTGATWLDDERVAALDVERAKLETKYAEALQKARNKHTVYEDVTTNPDPEGTLAVVTEALTTESRLRACVSALRQGSDCDIIAAAPVGVADVIAEVESVVDEVVVEEVVSETRLNRAFYDGFGMPLGPGYSESD